MSHRQVRVSPPTDPAHRKGKGPFRLVRDWNPHTPQTPPADDAYREGWERIFGRKDKACDEP